MNAGGTTQRGEQTLAAMLRVAPARHGDSVAMRVAGGGREITFAELGEAVDTRARALMSLGIEHGDRVAIIGETRPEWTFLDFAALAIGAVVVPIYHTSSPEQARFVLEHSGAKAAFFDGSEQEEKLAGIAGSCPDLENIVPLLEGHEPSSGPSLAEVLECGTQMPTEDLARRAAAVEPSDPCSLIYTSGTTGRPKGCVLSHGAYIANCEMSAAALNLGDEALIYVFLPLAHSMTRVTTLFATDQGHGLGYWRGDMARILDDIQELKPTHFPSAPRLFEKIYTAASSTEGAKARMLDWAVGVGMRRRTLEQCGARLGMLERIRYALADKLVLRRVRELFGGNLRLAVSGAAPIAPEILRFFDACGIPIMEGYGLTETSAATSANTPDAVRFGTVGKALPGAELRLDDESQILVSGPHLFDGYYKDPDATAKVLSKGWLATGDLGSLDEGDFLTIMGRKKDILITSSGKNISPANLENGLRQSRWISQAVVCGEARPYLVALLTLDPDELSALISDSGADVEEAKAATSEAVREVLQADVDAANGQVARIEQIKRFAVLPHELTLEAGELTATMKVKRQVVHQRYSEEIESLYATASRPEEESARNEPIDHSRSATRAGG